VGTGGHRGPQLDASEEGPEPVVPPGAPCGLALQQLDEPLACPPGVSDCPPSSSSRTCAPGKDNCARIHRTGFGCGVQADKQLRLNPGALPPRQPNARSTVVVAGAPKGFALGPPCAAPPHMQASSTYFTVAPRSGGTGLPARVEPKRCSEAVLMLSCSIRYTGRALRRRCRRRALVPHVGRRSPLPGRRSVKGRSTRRVLEPAC
jgi:hypothetical protein